jgi:hypothetical protein
MSWYKGALLAAALLTTVLVYQVVTMLDNADFSFDAL